MPGINRRRNEASRESQHAQPVELYQENHSFLSNSFKARVGFARNARVVL